MVLLPCEHAPNTAGKAPGYANLVTYTGAGGRAFITHYNYTWIRANTTQFPQTANWTNETKYFNDATDFPMDANVNQTFQKGIDFANWLHNVGASPVTGIVNVNHAVRNTDSVFTPPNGGTPPARAWLTSPAAPRPSPGGTISQQILHQYTFNTPVGLPASQQCGRVVYSAFHVNDASSDTLTFPAECNTNPMTAQERVLEFMFLDLA